MSTVNGQPDRASGGGHPRMRRRGRRSGLTLVEVLIAITILGVGIAVLVASTARGLAVARKAKYFETARHLLAVVELEEPIVDLLEVVDTEQSGEFESPYQDYRWTRTAELVETNPDPSSTVQADDGSGLYKITTRVYWADRGQQVFEETVTAQYLSKSAAAASASGLGGGSGLGEGNSLAREPSRLGSSSGSAFGSGNSSRGGTSSVLGPSRLGNGSSSGSAFGRDSSGSAFGRNSSGSGTGYSRNNGSGRVSFGRDRTGSGSSGLGSGSSYNRSTRSRTR